MPAMLKSSSRFLVAAALATFGSFPTGIATAQIESGQNALYIRRAFHAAIGEPPKLAWVLPDGTIAADENSPTIAVYSWDSGVQIARQSAWLPDRDVPAFVKEHHVNCDAVNNETPGPMTLYKSSLKPGDRSPQVFYTVKPLPGIAAGYSRGQLEGRAASEVWDRMRPESSDQPRKSQVIQREGVPFFFSIAALYGGPKKELVRQGLFLHALDGPVVAESIQDMGPEDLCDGCAMPTFEESIERVYPVINFFTAPQFAYPVLMVDTSTVEGRAISLVTFTPERKYSEYRLYEYVVNCF